MPINFNEILVTLILPAIKAVGKVQLKEVLSKIQEYNSPAVYANTLKSINSSFGLLKEVALKSKTKVDDGIIDTILEAVQEAAAEDGIIL